MLNFVFQWSFNLKCEQENKIDNLVITTDLGQFWFQNQNQRLISESELELVSVKAVELESELVWVKSELQGVGWCENTGTRIGIALNFTANILVLQ